MNIQQLRAIHEVVRQGLRVSGAAKALRKAQPGISRQLKEIENELGIQIFRRSKNRIVELTPAGHEVVRVVERILHELATLRTIGTEFSSGDSGSLVVATTHTHARYSLPRVVEEFVRQFPQVKVTLRQGNPVQCCEFVAQGAADVAIATETAHSFPDVISLPVYRIAWDLLARASHPIMLEKRPLTVEKIARYPLITHDAAFSGRRVFGEALAKVRRLPHVVLDGADAHVSKAYVERGLGLAMLAKIAFEPQKDTGLRLLHVEHLFKPSVLSIWLRRRTYPRRYLLSFVSLYAPHLDAATTSAALAGSAVDVAALRRKMRELI